MTRGRPRVFDDDTLLDAAATELITHGFERMTMDAVASRCGTTKQTLYARQGDKARLVSAVGLRACARIREHLVSAYMLARGRDLRHQVREGMYAVATFAREHPGDFVVLTATDWPGRNELAEALQRDLIAEIVISLRAGAPWISEETAEDSAALVVSLGWTAALRSRGGDADRVERLTGLATALAVDGMAQLLVPESSALHDS